MFGVKHILSAAVLIGGLAGIGMTQSASAQQYSSPASYYTTTPSYTPGYGGTSYRPTYIPAPTYCPPPVVYCPPPRPVVYYPEPYCAPTVRIYEPYRSYEPVRYFSPYEGRREEGRHDRFDLNFRFGR